MNVTKMQHYAIATQDKPGAWAEMMNICKEKNVDLAGIWGWGMEGKANFMVVPKEPAAFQQAMQDSSIQTEEGTCFFLSAGDQVGALCEACNKIAESGINLQAVDAIGVDGKVGCYIWCTPEDVDKVAGLLQ